MARSYCIYCTYPISACLCHAVSPIQISTEVIVMQHHSEVHHAKNTVRLMQLVIPEIKVVVGESQTDFSQLKAYLDTQSKPIYVVYPSDNSVSVSQANPANNAIIILIDGTWRKAYKILQSNPWLLEYTALHLDVEHASNYIIRKAKRPDSLSTLEATALLLSAMDSAVDTTPLFAAFDAMVQHRLSAMPEGIKARYQLHNKEVK
ncbi:MULTISPECIES: tRNA-uridine aminocarboxypropyltransferase [Pseudomonadati]|uniref:tRNA-uridine aminocarboxypropyltransferase n=1 Tax=Shewanella aestuarii TaxID=1028752 RepID=A0ABT0L3I3_9GAMM|nr:tRNA-uridine aminocarboxypropyltransferase [Shewanella aestuarii]MCL1118040.1 DTW domain-containing protein [Shewanella aestuarii]